MKLSLASSDGIEIAERTVHMLVINDLLLLDSARYPGW